jgi:hypothetical protein
MVTSVELAVAVQVLVVVAVLMLSQNVRRTEALVANAATVLRTITCNPDAAHVRAGQHSILHP